MNIGTEINVNGWKGSLIKINEGFGLFRSKEGKQAVFKLTWIRDKDIVKKIATDL